ncbi:PAS domain S-box protein [Lyngbya aestuarii]|uniref:PAS domain S-box protein n=1 Tax=Lyngbya aestuarii TaxID=118322 RepID=UPI00403D7E13
MNSIFNKLFNNHSIEYLTLDQNLIILEKSSGVQLLADRPEKVIQGKDVRLSFPELIGVEDILVAVLQRRRASFELKGINRSLDDCSPLYIDLYVIEQLSEKNLESRLVVFVKDVTELMVSQQQLVQRASESELLLNALAASQGYLNKIISSMAEVLLVVTVSGIIKKVNQAAQNLLGYFEFELINQPLSLIITDNNWRHSITEPGLRSQGEFLQRTEVICRTKTGEEITVEFSCSVIDTEITNPPEFVYIGRDISERKQVAEALRQSEERFQEAFESAAIGMALVSLDGRWLQVNLALCEMLGYDEPELLATTLEALTYPDDLETNITYRQQVLSGEIRTYQIQKRYFHKLGHLVWVSLSVSLVRNTQGQPLYFIVQIQDLTDRKRAEEELERFFNLSIDMLCVAGTDGYFKRLNPAFTETLGYTTEELLAQPFLDFIHPDDRAKTLVEMKKLAVGTPTIQFQNRYLGKDGVYRWLSWTVFPVVELGFLYAVARNITENKQVENERIQLLEREQVALAESEAVRNKITNILESITDGFFALDSDWRFTYLNQQSEPLLQRKPEGLLGKNVWDEFPEAVVSKFYDEYHRAVTQQISVEFEEFYPPLNSWFEVHAYPTADGLSVYFQDITARKQAEDTLRRNAQVLENFSANLKHLHRISTTNYEDFEALFVDYLETGCEILGMQTGIINQVNDQSCTIIAVRSNFDKLSPGLELPVGNTYCAQVFQEKRTITYVHVGSITAMQAHPIYQELRLESYIGTPIWVNSEVYGTLNFSSTQIRNSDFPPQEQEIVELMAQSIGRFIAAHQTAISRQQVVEELRRQNQKSQLFAELTLKIRQSLQLEEILQTTVTEVQSFLEADRVVIFRLWSDKPGKVVSEAVVAGWPVILGQNIDDPCFREQYQEKYRQGRISTITDIDKAQIAACHAELLSSFGVKANLVIPIFQRSELWGLLIAHQCAQARQWSSFETELLQQIADQVGIALAQSQLLEAVRESEQRFRTMADSAPVLLWMSGQDGLCTFFNQNWLIFTGRDLDQERGNGWSEGVHPEDLQQCMETHRTAFNTRKDFQMEYRRRRADGEYRWILDKGTPRFTPDGSFAGYIGCCIDISDRREIEQLKDEFISVVSHELRTPLTSILGALDLLASGVLRSQPEQGQRMLDIAANNADRLVRLINDILDIERIESGKVMMTKQVCDGANLMNISTELMRNMAQKAGVNLSAVPKSVRLWADPDRIIQVFTNLLSNAIKFSPPDSTVWLRAQLQEESEVTTDDSGLSVEARQIVFQVQDQGRGIPADKLETIFGRFQQVDASDSRTKGGTGLGLAICRSIIQHHGGQIWAESTLGEGSTFYFTLPVLQEEREALALDPTKPTVLVCDDDASVRAVVQTMLKQQGYQVIAVTSGEEAVEHAEQDMPDVILLNLMMPSMHGWETLEALKANLETKNIPVIILSGLMPDARESPHPGVSDWLIKPPDERLLFQALERALTKPNHQVKVLIIEDDLDLAQVLVTLFEGYGIETYHAQTGPEAIELSQRVIPDLLVLDLILPECDGFAVVGWLRQHNRLRRVPLVVYTAEDLDQSERELLKLGQTLFLTKSRITPEEFEQRVISLLNSIVQGREGESNHESQTHSDY